MFDDKVYFGDHQNALLCAGSIHFTRQEGVFSSRKASVEEFPLTKALGKLTLEIQITLRGMLHGDNFIEQNKNYQAVWPLWPAWLL